MVGDAAQHAEHHRYFLLREQVHLQIEVIALVALDAHAVLGNQHENGEDDPFHGDEHGEQTKRVRIEATGGGACGIPPAPSGQRQRLADRKRDRADDAGDGKADS